MLNFTLDKDFIGYLSLALTIAAYAPYIYSTLKGHTKPHIFSWVLWGTLMLIASAGQHAGHAGPGAWATALSGIFSVIIALLALRQGDKDITNKDIAVFIIALMGIPLWYVTQNPLSAILLMTVIDALCYIPTLRKSFHKPKEEMALHYIISNTKLIVSIAAMSVYSLTTVIYPAMIIVMNTALIALIFARRLQLAKLAP